MEIAISEFKVKAFALLEKIHKDGRPLIVLKRGKPLVKVMPVTEKKGILDFEYTFISQAEDIFSTGENWDAQT